MQEHYGAVKAGQQAGGVTYFAFLSVFPILALSFFVVGWIARVYPHARTDLRNAINGILPGLVGSGEGQVQIRDIEHAASAVGFFGFLALLYSGLGWLSATRDALVVVFELPAKEQPNYVVGKLRDLAALVLIGLILFVSVAVAGLIGGFSSSLLDWAGLGSELGWVVKVLTVLLGLGANVVLFFTIFVLAEPHTPRRSLWSGAVLGAVAFEVLKQLAGQLLSATQGSPAFQAFGIAVILVVWINYFSRVVLYAAAWAHTTPEARAARDVPAAAPVQGPPSPPLSARPGLDPGGGTAGALTPYAVGAAGMLALMAVVRKLVTRRDA